MNWGNLNFPRPLTVVGPALVSSILAFQKAYRTQANAEDRREATAHLIAAIFRRFVKVALISAFIGLSPAVILLWQTHILSAQTDVLERQVVAQSEQIQQTATIANNQTKTTFTQILDNYFEGVENLLLQPEQKGELTDMLIVSRTEAIMLRVNDEAFDVNDRRQALNLIIRFISETKPHLLAGVDEQFDRVKPYVDLSNRDYSECIFAKLNLEKALLNDCDFQRAIFMHANLKGANLMRSRCQGAFFMAADLEGADLRGAKFNNTNLRNANLKGAVIDEDTDFLDANLQGATWIDGTIK